MKFWGTVSLVFELVGRLVGCLGGCLMFVAGVQLVGIAWGMLAAWIAGGIGVALLVAGIVTLYGTQHILNENWDG